MNLLLLMCSMSISFFLFCVRTGKGSSVILVRDLFNRSSGLGWISLEWFSSGRKKAASLFVSSNDNFMLRGDGLIYVGVIVRVDLAFLCPVERRRYDLSVALLPKLGAGG